MVSFDLSKIRPVHSETATSFLPSVNSLPIHPYRGVAIRSGWDYFLAKEKKVVSDLQRDE